MNTDEKIEAVMDSLAASACAPESPAALALREKFMEAVKGQPDLDTNDVINFMWWITLNMCKTEGFPFAVIMGVLGRMMNQPTLVIPYSRLPETKHGN